MRLLTHSFLSFLLAFQPLTNLALAESQPENDLKVQASVKQLTALYSGAKNIKELEKIMSTNLSLRDQRYVSEVFTKFDPRMQTPKFSVKDNTIIIAGLGEPIHIDVSKAPRGRFVVDGVSLTVDPSASLQMQSEIFKRKLLENKDRQKGSFSLFSLLVSEAHAAGKAQVIRSGLKSAAQKAKEAKEAAPNKKGIGAAFKEQARVHVPILTIVGIWELIKLFGIDKACALNAYLGEVEATPENIQKATICKPYLNGVKTAADMSKAETEKKKKEDPKIAAAGTLESLQKKELAGVSFFNGWKACPHQSKDGSYRSALGIVTEDPVTKEKKIEMNFVKAEYDGTKLKEIKMFSSAPDGEKTPIATYIPEQGSLGTIKMPNPKFNAQASGLEAPELEIKVAKDNSSTDTEIVNKQKLHTEIYGKIMLSLGSCADDAKNAEGRKAAEGATKVAPPDSPQGTSK